MAAMCWRFHATVTVEARITSFAHLTDPAEAERHPLRADRAAPRGRDIMPSHFTASVTVSEEIRHFNSMWRASRCRRQVVASSCATRTKVVPRRGRYHALTGQSLPIIWVG